MFHSNKQGCSGNKNGNWPKRILGYFENDCLSIFEYDKFYFDFVLMKFAIFRTRSCVLRGFQTKENEK